MSAAKVKWVSLLPSQEIRLASPLTRGDKVSLKCLNFSQKSVAIKLKTTSPELFCCKPVAFFLDKGHQSEVEIRYGSR